jgi:hypothetical protein
MSGGPRNPAPFTVDIFIGQAVRGGVRWWNSCAEGQRAPTTDFRPADRMLDGRTTGFRLGFWYKNASQWRRLVLPESVCRAYRSVFKIRHGRAEPSPDKKGYQQSPVRVVNARCGVGGSRRYDVVAKGSVIARMWSRDLYL